MCISCVIKCFCILSTTVLCLESLDLHVFFKKRIHFKNGKSKKSLSELVVNQTEYVATTSFSRYVTVQAIITLKAQFFVATSGDFRMTHYEAELKD